MEKVKKFPRGGAQLPEEKHHTTHAPIEAFPAPREVALTLQQHIGGAAAPVVKPGDTVVRGQMIAEGRSSLTARIHASISGTVKGVERRPIPGGTEVDAVVIEREGDQGREETVGEPLSEHPTPDQVRKRVEEAGIVGLGGAAFPTHVKLNPTEPIDTVIVNGAECEPYLTTDDRLMQERAAELFRGLELIRTTVGAERGIVACETNKPDALAAIRAEAERWTQLTGEVLDTRYPHGAEKHLVKAVLEREIPRKALPTAVGVIVNNVQTTIAIADAVDRGRALWGRVLTVSGSGIANPKNLYVPLGTSMRDLVDYCGGRLDAEHRLVAGGPMTGIGVDDPAIPITKANSGVVLLTAEEYADAIPMECIRCNKCVDVCPMYLAPNRMVSFVDNDMIEEAVDAGLQDCVLCGVCEFSCPSKRDLLQRIVIGRAKAERRAER